MLVIYSAIDNNCPCPVYQQLRLYMATGAEGPKALLRCLEEKKSVRWTCVLNVSCEKAVDRAECHECASEEQGLSPEVPLLFGEAKGPGSLAALAITVTILHALAGRASSLRQEECPGL